MKRLLLLSLSFCALLPAQGSANDVDLSSPQSTYETCYSIIDFQSATQDIKDMTNRCLTKTAQKAVLSYAVLAGLSIDGLKDLHGHKKYPEIMLDINLILEKNGLGTSSKEAFRKTDLSQVLGDIIAVLSQNSFITEQLEYADRSLQNLDISDKSATGIEVFKFKKPLPANKLELRFVNVDDEWLINHISYHH